MNPSDSNQVTRSKDSPPISSMANTSAVMNFGSSSSNQNPLATNTDPQQQQQQQQSQSRIGNDPLQLQAASMADTAVVGTDTDAMASDPSPPKRQKLGAVLGPLADDAKESESATSGESIVSVGLDTQQIAGLPQLPIQPSFQQQQIQLATSLHILSMPSILQLQTALLQSQLQQLTHQHMQTKQQQQQQQEQQQQQLNLQQQQYLQQAAFLSGFYPFSLAQTLAAQQQQLQQQMQQQQLSQHQQQQLQLAQQQLAQALMSYEQQQQQQQQSEQGLSVMAATTAGGTADMTNSNWFAVAPNPLSSPPTAATAGNSPSSAALGQTAPDGGPGLTGRPPIVLYMTCDDDALSEYQCLVRKNIELFEANFQDIESNAQGRNRPIVLGQVGIQCRHCTSLAPKHRARGAVYYPAKLEGLYQAAQNQANGHLAEYCNHIPPAIRQELLRLKDRKSSAGGGKKYWADGVRVLGVYEDANGLRFTRR
ncbi:hypothetical protein ACA910_020896 [Epithemia clementina (nom. ined.)]